ncbi:MAG TPA: DUF979 family protein, partial [Lacunisphaera sp.]|nr:DUF979 family protein [Lacunisphaera sp.]
MSPGLSLEHFFLLVGLFVAAVAVRLAGNPAHPRRWGSAGFWLLLAITIGAGKYLPAELVGWMVLAMGLLVAAKQVAAPYFPTVAPSGRRGPSISATACCGRSCSCPGWRSPEVLWSARKS